MATPLQVDLSLAIQSRVLEDKASLRDVPDDRLDDCLAIVYAWYGDLSAEKRHRLNLEDESLVRLVLSREGGRLAIVARRLRTS